MQTKKESLQVHYLAEGTIRRYLAAFTVERRARGVVEGTLRYYLNELNLFVAFLDRQRIVLLRGITPDLIRAYLLDLERTRNPGGRHAAYRAIRAFLNWCMDEFELGDHWKNPIDKIRPPKVVKNPLPGIEIDTFKRMIEACNTGQSKRDRSILMTLLDTGLRASELLSLNVGDCDLFAGGIIVRKGKGGKARTVFLGARARKALRAYLKERGALFENDPLFITDEGNRIKYQGLLRLIQRRAKSAGIVAPHLHDFRRSFALMMVRGGADLTRLAAIMGHSGLEVLRVYLRYTESDLQAIHAQASPVDRANL
jgi:integrase/recombinase XerD